MIDQDTALSRLRDAKPDAPLDYASRIHIRRRLSKRSRKPVLPWVVLLMAGSVAIAANAQKLISEQPEPTAVPKRVVPTPSPDRPDLPDTTRLREAIERLRAGDAAGALAIVQSSPERTTLREEFGIVELNALVALERRGEANEVIERLLALETIPEERRSALEDLARQIEDAAP